LRIEQAISCLGHTLDPNLLLHQMHVAGVFHLEGQLTLAYRHALNVSLLYDFRGLEEDWNAHSGQDLHPRLAAFECLLRWQLFDEDAVGLLGGG